MARDSGAPVLRAPPAPPPGPGLGPVGAAGAGLWPALLVGLLAALLAWLWYGRGDGEPAGERGAGPREAAGEPARAGIGRPRSHGAAAEPPVEAGDAAGAPVGGDEPENEGEEEDEEEEREALGEAPGAEDSDGADGDPRARRVAAVPPMPQNVQVTFRVHYLTGGGAQGLGVTGDHECLGRWRSYVPLRRDKDGFWAEAVALPADTRLEWKFILVENGKVARWEECGNRTLVTEHEDQTVHRWWGYH